MQRTERLLAITLLLQARGKMTARHLAELLGVSIRTIYRDIDALSMAHVAISMDYGPGGGYYLLNDHHIEAASFTREEAISLVLGGMLVGNYSLFADDDALHRALLKLEATLPEEYRDALHAAQERILFDTKAWYSQPQASAYLEIIRAALWQNQQLEILYPSQDGSTSIWRHIDPYGIVYKGLSRKQMRVGIWYLIALCHCCQHVHPYRIGYIQEVKVLDTTASPRSDFNLQSYWRTARQSLEQTPSLPLTLHVQASARHRLRDEGTLLKEEPDGSIIVCLLMESIDAATSYALSLGPRVRVLSPAKVQKAIAETARQIAAQYEIGEE